VRLDSIVAAIRHRNHGGDHFVLMPLERQVRRHERTKRAEGMEEHVGEKRMARYDAGRFRNSRIDGGSVFDGIEPALCFHRALDAIVFVHSNSLDPGHASQLLEPAIILKLISNRRARSLPVTLCVGALTVIAFFGPRRCEGDADVFVNRLPLVVVLGMSLAVRPVMACADSSDLNRR